MILKFKVYEQTISLQSTKSEPRQGSKDYLELQFSFSADWNDLSKYVYLQHGEVSVPHDLVEESIIVDEYFTEQTEFNVTLLGKSADGSIEVPTNVVTVFLKESNNLWVKDAPEPQNSWLVQVVDARDEALAAAIRAENAAIHQPYPNAKTGTWWVWNTDSGAYTDTGVSAGGSITVDSELSDASENPVQNKVIKSALDAKLAKSGIASKTPDMTQSVGVDEAGALWTVPVSGGGGGLPSGGTPYQQLVTDGNGNTQWEDRLTYSFEDTVEVLPKMSVSVVMDEQDGLCLYRIDLNTTFETGKSYTVVFDETEYKVIAQIPGAIGNLSFMGAGPDTGEPFVVISHGILGTPTNGEHSIQITCTGIVYHKLSSEYIQNGDVVRVHDKYTMTDEDAAHYDAVFNNNESSIIIWGRKIFTNIRRIEGDSGFIGLRLRDVSGKEYIVYKNDDGLYSIGDLFESEFNLELLKGGKLNSCGISIKSYPNPIVIEPGSYSGSEPTENIVLLRVKNNGIKNMYAFEVLGNGTIKTRSVILPSSTSGSTKQFRITVDDTGTISATEVT